MKAVLLALVVLASPAPAPATAPMAHTSPRVPEYEALLRTLAELQLAAARPELDRVGAEQAKEYGEPKPRVLEDTSAEYQDAMQHAQVSALPKLVGAVKSS